MSKIKSCIITNDDGDIDLLRATISVVEKLFESVTTIIPACERSGISSAISLNKEWVLEEKHIENTNKYWTVSSTPSDGIRYAIRNIEPNVGILISGINNGYNLGYSIINSGTVGAAYEGIRFGLNGVCLSACHRRYIINKTWLKTISDILTAIVNTKEIYKYGPGIININLPIKFKYDNQKCKVLPVSRVYYNEWYEKSENDGASILCLRGDDMIIDNNVPDIEMLNNGIATVNIITTPWTKNPEKYHSYLKERIEKHL
jgi:5'-nucleotidase